MTKKKRICSGERTVFDSCFLGKLDSCMQKNEVTILPYTIARKELKWVNY